MRAREIFNYLFVYFVLDLKEVLNPRLKFICFLQIKGNLGVNLNERQKIFKGLEENISPQKLLERPNYLGEAC